MSVASYQQLTLRHAGLAVGPLAWATNTQLAQILPYAECSLRLPVLAAASFVLVIASLGATWLSWHVAGRQAGHTTIFVAQLSALTGALFTFALILQGLSSLVLSGCER
jgi:hypothetical protein